MNIPGLTTTKRAAGAITARRLLMLAGAGLATQAVSGGNAIAGVSTDIDTADGQPVDIVRSQLTPVEYGGDIAEGDLLTADAEGRAVAVTLPVADTTHVIGYAELDGAEGDIGSVFIAPTVLTA